MDNVSDLSKAQSLIEEIRRCLMTSGWVFLPILYTQLRHLYNSLSVTIPSLPNEQKQELKKVISEISAIESTVNKKWSSGLSQNEVSRADATLRNQSDMLHQIDNFLKRKAN